MPQGSIDASTSLSLGRELEVATALARAAGEVARRHRAAGIAPGRKADGEIVTAADREVDALVRERLAEEFPGDAVLSEEAPDSPDRLARSRAWIVDPIDGTLDFARGGDQHAVSIGLAVDGAAVLGVVYNPARDELFTGCAGAGASLNGARVRVSAAREVSRSRLVVSGTEWREGLLRPVETLPIRPVSSAAYKLARVAAGLDDGTFSACARQQWDLCAGVALVAAGGGRVTFLDGTAIRFNGAEVRLAQGLIAAGPGLHGPLSRELARRGLGPHLPR